MVHAKKWYKRVLPVAVFVLLHSPKVLAGQDVEAPRAIELSTGQQARHIVTGRLNPTNVAFSADGKLLTVNFRFRPPVTLDTETWKQANRLPSSWMVDYSRTDDLLIVAEGKDGLTLRRPDGKLLVALEKPGDEVFACARFSADGTKVASAKLSGEIVLWDTASKRKLCTLDGHEGEVLAVQFSGDGKSIYSVGVDSSIHIWSAQNGAAIKTINTPPGEPITGLAVAGDGSGLVTLHPKTGAAIWNPKNWRATTRKGYICAANSATSGWVAIGGQDIVLWDCNTNKAIEKFSVASKATPHLVTAIAFSADGSTLAAAQATGDLFLLKLPPQPRRREDTAN